MRRGKGKAPGTIAAQHETKEAGAQNTFAIKDDQVALLQLGLQCRIKL
ncbi:hypothetical protein ACFQFQ_13660 [Sulfitobacter porphyrae]|uniref:Uncharacterized protein n=1 Tax=Sulfitobacter porphyrae TaxID=1246864 RepID=A0ABW2B3K6_9RHOB